MDWHNISLMLADAATSPAMLLIGALIVFIAGVACGALGRLAAFNDAIADEPSGDTHAHLTFPPDMRPRLRAGQPPTTCTDGTRRRVRALHSADDRH